MSKSTRVQKAAILIMAGFSSHLQAVCDGDWTGGGVDNNWTTPANWNGCIPGVAGDAATFSANTSNNNPNVNVPETLNSLTFDTTAVSYTIGGAGPLTLSGSDATIQVLSGTHTINTQLVLNPPDNLLIDLVGNLSITVPSVLSNVGTSVTIDGTGILTPISFFDTYDCTINGTTIIGTTGNGLRALNTLVMNGGSFVGEGFGSELTALGAMTINGGTVVLENTGVLGTLGLGTTLSITGGSVMLFNDSTVLFSSIVEISGGLLTLDSSSQFFQCSTLNVSGGELIHNGTTMNMQAINLTGGRIRGLGTFSLQPGFEFINSGGIVEPGDAPGTLTLDVGTYVQTSDGTLQIDFLSPTVFGSFATQNSTIDGTLLLVGLPGFNNASGTVFEVLTTEPAGLSGTFATIEELNFPSSLVPLVTYTDEAVLVSFANALPAFISVKELVFSNINQINYLLFNRLQCRCGFDVYLDPIGSVGKVRSKKATKGYDFYTAGALLGGDYATPCFIVGAEADYQRFHGSVYDRFGCFDLDQFHGSVYGTMKIFDQLYFDGIIGGGYQRNSLKRRTGFTHELHAKSSQNATIFDALGGLEYRGYIMPFNVTPFVTAQYIQYHVSAANDSSAENFNLHFERQNYESLRTTLGLRLEGTYCIYGVRIHPSINGAWQREYLKRKHLLSYQNPAIGFVPSEIEIAESSRNFALAGGSLEVFLSKCLSAEVAYEFEGSSRLINNFIYLGLNAAF